MRNKESIKELLNYFQAVENKELQLDENAIVTAYQENKDNQSLAIKVLSVFGVVLASLAFLGFLFLAGLYNSDSGLLIFGAFCIAGAIWINKEYNTIIIDTVSVSSFIIGLILATLGLARLEMTANAILIVLILIVLLSSGIVQKYIFSFISVLIIHGSVLMLIIFNEYYDLIHIYISALVLMVAYIFLREAKIITTSAMLLRLYNPIRIGLIFSFLSGLIILGKNEILPISPDYIWLPSIVIIAAIIYFLSHLFEILNITKTPHKVFVYTWSVLLLLSTVWAPTVSGAILIILLSFFVNYKTGLVIGIIAFIYFISQYYYDLHFTLLTKSILLFSSGLLFIGLYLFTHKRLISNEKV